MKTYLVLTIFILALLCVSCSSNDLPNQKGRIVFVSAQKGNSDIYSINANGEDLKHLTDNPSQDLYPKWSPDGKKIAFISDQDTGNFQRSIYIDQNSPIIYVMNADGSNKIPLNISDYNLPSWNKNGLYIWGSLEWSPDGKQIIFEADHHLITLDIETGKAKDLTLESEDQQPSWSPDGKTIIFQNYYLGLSKPSNGDYNNIYSIQPDGGNRINLMLRQLNEDAEVINPVWSPDGHQISFVKKIYPQSINVGPLRINPFVLRISVYTYVIQVSNGQQRMVTDQCAGEAWSPDGEWIVCSAKINGDNFEIYIVNVADGKIFQLTHTSSDESNADWSP